MIIGRAIAQREGGWDKMNFVRHALSIGVRARWPAFQRQLLNRQTAHLGCATADFGTAMESRLYKNA
jgi:hypothetical protein